MPQMRDALSTSRIATPMEHNKAARAKKRGKIDRFYAEAMSTMAWNRLRTYSMDGGYT